MMMQEKVKVIYHSAYVMKLSGHLGKSINNWAKGCSCPFFSSCLSLSLSLSPSLSIFHAFLPPQQVVRILT